MSFYDKKNCLFQLGHDPQAVLDSVKSTFQNSFRSFGPQLLPPHVSWSKNVVLSILVGHPPHTTPTMRIFQLHNCKILTKNGHFSRLFFGWHGHPLPDRWHPVVGLINGYLDEGLVVPQPRLELTLRSLLPWNWRTARRTADFRSISEERTQTLLYLWVGSKAGGKLGWGSAKKHVSRSLGLI